jgi:hypothetical protein
VDSLLHIPLLVVKTVSRERGGYTEIGAEAYQGAYWEEDAASKDGKADQRARRCRLTFERETAGVETVDLDAEAASKFDAIWQR